MDRVQKDICSVIAKKELFEHLRNSSVLVTGATGLIGSMLVKTVLEANEAYGLNIKLTGQIRDREKAVRIFGELTDRFTLSLTDSVPCNYIVHTVSPTTSKFFIEHPVETIRASVESAISVLEVARKNKASVVYLSSMEQYGVPFTSGEQMTEEKTGIIDHLNVRSSYSESKRLCECLCASYACEYGVDVKIARLAQTFGAGVSLSDHRMPMQFARSVVEERDIVLHTEGKSVSNFVYLTDAIAGILLLLSRQDPGSAFNICNDGETRSVREIAELVADKVANGKIAVQIEKQDNLGYAPDNTFHLNSDKLRSLGWKPEVGMEEAYRRLAEYLRAASAKKQYTEDER